MSDAERVHAIERKAELRLLERLLVERERPVPPPPAPRPVDPSTRQLLIDVMHLIAEAMHDNYPRQGARRVEKLAVIHRLPTAESPGYAPLSTRSAQAIGGSL